MNDTVLTRVDGELGEFAVRPVDLDADLTRLHSWLNDPKSAFWMMNDTTPQDVRKMFDDIAAEPGHAAFIGSHGGEPTFLIETYDPAHSELSAVYTPRPGDAGMHFLVAATDQPLRGFTLAVIRTVMELLFADPDTLRVIVEPDVRNRPVHALNAAVGFQVDDTVELTGKQAYLSSCTREQYRATIDAGQKATR